MDIRSTQPMRNADRKARRPSVPTLPTRHRPAGLKAPEQARREQRQAFDRKRGREQPWRALYKLPGWQRVREAQLARQPLCERCLERGIVTAANVVNHRRRHRGDQMLFFDPANHESCCKRCHDREIQREERAVEWS
jgi:5-methylcytosine-specific restriction protein A